ncbi:MAG: TatD family hydrolase [Ignavibacteriae bacterium]|nr:TatD family hydrolase [Ignavibacteriota bacterium]
MIIDTHAHLYYPDLKDRIEEILVNAVNNGITKIIAPAIDLKTSEAILELASKHEMIYAAVGFHPGDIPELTDKDFDSLESLLKEDKVVAIGETGLDYYWDITYKDKQKDFFKRHLELSEKYNLPVIIHTRDSVKDAITIIKESKLNVKGQFHCFSGDSADLQDAIALDTYCISYCGNITYKNFDALDLVRQTPVNKLLAETDSPFLTPVPHRGKKNEPAFVKHTIEKMAHLQNTSFESLVSQLEINTRALFPKAF